MSDFVTIECAVRQLYARYADAVWRQDGHALADCFTDDAVWKIAGRQAEGRAEIRALFEASIAPSERVMFWNAPPLLSIAGGAVTARVQVTELIKRRDGAGVRTLGWYFDHFAGAGADWRIARHHFDLFYYGAPDLSGVITPWDDYGPPPTMPGPDAPTPERR